MSTFIKKKLNFIVTSMFFLQFIKNFLLHSSIYNPAKGIAIIPILIFLLESVHYTSKSMLDFSCTIDLLVNFLLFLIIKYAIPILSSYINREMPLVFYFISIPLMSTSSGSNGDKAQILAERAKINGDINEVKIDIVSTKSDLKEVKNTLRMTSIINDTQNNALTDIKNKYETFFDAESGNTTQEGLKQIVEELNEDLRSHKRELKALTIKHDEVKKKLEEFETSSQLIFVIRPLHSFVYLASLRNYIATCISLLVTIFSLGLAVLYVFTNLQIDTPYFIQSIEEYIQSIIKYEIFISLSLFMWSCFSI